MSEEYQIIKTSLGNIPGIIYLSLVKNGEMTVPKLVIDLKLSRTIIYEGLAELLADNYVTYRKEGRNAFYSPAHPDKLLDLIAFKKREAESFASNIKDTVDSLRGFYNTAMHRPGVRFFEGEEGLREVWWDILKNTDDEFCTISDHESIIKKVSILNDEWLQERNKKKD
jgi:sugar-specific transcriptional regulator TrmB